MTALIIAGSVLFLVSLYIIPCLIVSRKLLNPRPIPVGEPPLPDYENISFTARAGFTARGWVLPAKTVSAKWIVLVHGYRSNRLIFENKVDAERLFRQFHQWGFNIMTFDFINTGESDRDICSVGYYERQDLNDALNFLRKRQPEAEIGLIGWSQGAAVSIMTAAERNDIKYVIADSPFADLDTYLRGNLPVWSRLPAVTTPFILWLMKKGSGLVPSRVSPVRSVTALKGSLLLIHNRHDRAIPVENSRNIAAAAPDETTELMLFEGKRHARACLEEPQTYFRTIKDFLSANRVLPDYEP